MPIVLGYKIYNAPNLTLQTAKRLVQFHCWKIFNLISSVKIVVIKFTMLQIWRTTVQKNEPLDIQYNG